MANFLDNKKSALAIIVILAVGAISGVATAQFVMASQIGKLCVFFACGKATINGGTSGGQPTPNTGKLIVTKVISDPLDRCGSAGTTGCSPSDFTITVTGNNPSPDTFKGSATGTTVTLGPGKYTVSEAPNGNVGQTISGNCLPVSGTPVPTASGTIAAGETQTCTFTNQAS